MEGAGELERIGRQLMHAVVLTDVVDELREPENSPDEPELAHVVQERKVGAVLGDPALGRRPEDACDPRVRVLDVVHGVLVRLLDGKLEVEIELAIGARLKEEVARRILADGLDHLLEQQELAGAPAHPLQYPLVEEANVLIEDDLESIEEPEGLHRGAHLDEVVVRVRSPDVDLLVEAAIPK